MDFYEKIPREALSFRVNMGMNIRGISLGLLVMAMTTLLYPEEKSDSDQLEFSIQSGPDRRLIWDVLFPDGVKKDLTENEKRQLIAETIFPRVMAGARAGKEPEVWKIGFFYLDGMGTERDLEKAEAAFRVGLTLNRPEGLLFLGDYFHEKGISGKVDATERAESFLRAETLYREVLAAGHEHAASFAISLATAHLFGWYGLEQDPEKADSLLLAVEKAAPNNPSLLLWKAKSLVHQKKYSEAFTYAEKAQKGFLAQPKQSNDTEEEWKLARAVKITAAILGREISRIDPEEFLETSKESLGLTGKRAWIVPGILLILLGFLLGRTCRSWKTGEGSGPGLGLSFLWISAASLAAGIGFTMRLPGLDNAAGHWIGAILVTITTLLAVSIGGWSRYFGKGPWLSGARKFFIGLAIIVGGIVGMQLVAMGYGELYKLILGRATDPQLVSLFLKNGTLPQLLGTLLIVGLAIPFYEEVFFRGFLFDALQRRWSARIALVGSSVFFALIHGITFAIPLLFLSFAIGWLRLRNGSLRMSFLLHAANNSFAVLVGYFSSGG